MQETETIAGVLESIRFYNEETYFVIGKIRVDGGGHEVTVKGILPAVQCGETLELVGSWINNKTYGREFNISSFKSKLPSSAHGIRKYLGSGSIPGIGKTYAEKIVKHFGTDTLRVISEESSRLREVPGIGPERVKKIKASWEEQSAMREIMLFLYTYGVTPSQCTRIIKTYGNNAKKVIQENPYQLSKDIAGIAFPTADNLARNLGIPNESMWRIGAGILYTLEETEQRGNTACPQRELENKAASLLNVPIELVQKGIKELRAEKSLRSVAENVAELIARREVGRSEFVEAEGNSCQANELLQNVRQARAELQIAESVARILSAKSELPPIKIKIAVEWAQNKAGIEFAPEQAHAVATALSSKFSIITGGPGTGKTTILHALCKILKAKDVKITLAAPTGRAAQRMSDATGIPAGTIHRILKPDSQLRGFVHNENSPLKTDFIVVDEASMLDNALADSLLRAIPDAAHVVFVGDVNQLPSVGAGNILGDLIASRIIPVTTLSAVFRQGKRSGIVSTAHAILHGDTRVPEPRQLSIFDFDPRRDIHFIESTSNEDCERKVVALATKAIPRVLGIKSCEDIQILSPMLRREVGVDRLNEVLQNEFTSGGDKGFRVGDKVLQNRNNYDKGVFNGDLGRVESLDSDEGLVWVRFGDDLVKYERADLSELQLAYAITIHKSQGSEFSVVIVPIISTHSIMLQRNLLYTAITRGRRKVFIVGEPKAYEMAVKKIDSSRRLTGLNALLATVRD